MSTNHTPNYSLSQWEADDKVLRTDFNGDNAKLDAALKSMANRLKSRGNCSIRFDFLTGTGVYGQANKQPFYFSGSPAIGLIVGGGAFMIVASDCDKALAVTNSGIYLNHVEWNGTRCYFYSDTSAKAMMNEKGVPYRYTSIYTEK